MLFSNVVGQQGAKDGLLKMWHNNVLPHALMIVGSEGTGGLPMGLALAQYIFCENKSATDSCGVCPSCSKVSKLEHADLHLTFPAISPKPGTKAMSRFFISEFKEFVQQSPYGTTYDWLQFINAENKQGNIPAEECREIIDKLNLKSYEGGKKIQIIWRPEYLGKEGNMLLKLIEEPPNDTVIIMIAEDMDDILGTIRSRTQTVRLSPVSAADIALGLTARSLTDPKRAAQVAHMAMGSYTEALKLVRHTDNDLFPDVKDLFNALFLNSGPGISKFAEEWSKAGREQQKNILHYIIQLLEQGIRARYLPNAEATLPPDEAEFARKLGTNSKIDFEKLQQMIAIISDTIFFIERNAHAKTQLHAMGLRLVYVVQGRSEQVIG